MDPAKRNSRAATAESLLSFDVPATVLIGELGLGKTTLLRDVARRASRAVTFITCRSSANSIPFEPLQALLQAVGRDGQPRDELRLSSSADAALVRDALAHTVSDEPRLFILDDLQWADSETLKMLPYLVDRLQDYPIAWIFAARPGYKNVELFAGEVLHTGAARTVELLPLPEVEIASELSQLKTDVPIDVAAIAKQANGNPLFAVLLASARSGAFASAEIVVSEQVEALDEEDRTSAQALAVINRPTTVDMLSIILRRQGSMVERSVSTLVNRRIASAHNGAIELSHPIWSSALIASARPEQLARVHAALASNTQDPGERARHLLAAGEHDAAREAFATLAWRSLLSNRTQEAKEFATLALTAQAPGSTPLSAQRSLAALLRLTTRFADTRSEAIATAARIDEWEHLAVEVVARLELAHSIFYRTPWSNVDEAQRLLKIASATSEPRVKAELLYRAAIIYVWLLAWENVDAVSYQIEDGAEEALLPGPRLLARVARAMRPGLQGESAASLEQLERVFHEADVLNESEIVIETAYRACQIAMYNGCEERVLPMCERVLRIQEAPSAKRHFLAKCLAVLRQNLGNSETALALVYSLGEDLSDLDVGSRSVPTFVKIFSSSCLGLFADAAKALEAWLASDTPDRVGLVAWGAGNFYELSERYDDAVHWYSEVIRTNALVKALGNNLLAALALHRIAYVTRDAAVHQLALDQEALFERAKTELPTYYLLRLGYEAAYAGKAAQAAAHLREGAALSGLSPFERSVVLLTVAKLENDLPLLESCAGKFQELGAAFMVDRTMGLAAELKMRARPPKLQGPLSQRERSVAFLLAAGKTNPEIADELSISRRTVETHVANILIKLGLRSRIDVAVQIARGA